jgi:homoserine kinase type II
VYTKLDDLALKALWSVYDDDKELVSAQGIAAGSINTTYRLQTEAGAFFLRVHEDRAVDDILYERDLLDTLRRAPLGGVTVPEMKRTRIGGTMFLVDDAAPRKKWAVVFPELPGRDLGIFEVEPNHARQVGAFLARAHHALRRFRGRPNPYGLPVVARWLDELVAVEPLRDVALRLRAVHARVMARRRPLPRGTIHGDLFVDNTKWQRGSLAAVFDWEMAGRDALVRDLVICLLAWCWRRDRGAFDDACCRALVDGYRAVRPLAPSEARALFGEALAAAVRFTTTRLRDFEVPRADRPADAHRTYLDYRDFLARLEVVEGLGDKGFRRLLGVSLP